MVVLVVVIIAKAWSNPMSVPLSSLTHALSDLVLTLYEPVDPDLLRAALESLCGGPDFWVRGTEACARCAGCLQRSLS